MAVFFSTPLSTPSDSRDSPIAPSIQAVLDKTYPIARKLYMYTAGKPSPECKEYIDWILSPAGQKIVGDAGYVPVPPGQKQGVIPAIAPAGAPPAEPGKTAGKK